MILSDIKKYLSARRRATIEDMALHFDKAPDAVRGMLSQWVRKGQVSRLETRAPRCANACPACSGCRAPEIYEWKQ